MHIKDSKELRDLARRAGASDVEKFGEELLDELIKRGVVEDIEDFYGKTITENPDATVTDLVETLHGAGIELVESDDFDNLVSLVFMGDGECPECGGTPEAICGGSRDWDTGEYEYEDITCPICGHVHRVYNSNR